MNLTSRLWIGAQCFGDDDDIDQDEENEHETSGEQLFCGTIHAHKIHTSAMTLVRYVLGCGGDGFGG